MKKSVDISVITPIFNASPYLEKYFNLLEKQKTNKLNIEIIIIDDASTDQSLKLIKSFNLKNINIIKLRSNLGVSAARNIGIQKASGNYIFFIDIDEISTENNSLKLLFSRAKKYNADFVSINDKESKTSLIKEEINTIF